MHQVTGFGAIVYSKLLFEGVSGLSAKAELALVLVALCNVLFALAALVLVRSVPRRYQLLGSLLIMSCGAVGCGVFSLWSAIAWFLESTSGTDISRVLGSSVWSHITRAVGPSSWSGLSMGLVGSALLFVAGFATGPGALTGLVVNEVFDVATRGKGNALAAVVNSISALYVGWLFHLLYDGINGFTFLVGFTGLICVAIVFGLKSLPKTCMRLKVD